jgi:hypothetical protein
MYKYTDTILPTEVNLRLENMNMAVTVRIGAILAIKLIKLLDMLCIKLSLITLSLSLF